jgi:hypothetical protein
VEGLTCHLRLRAIGRFALETVAGADGSRWERWHRKRATPNYRIALVVTTHYQLVDRVGIGFLYRMTDQVACSYNEW